VKKSTLTAAQRDAAMSRMTGSIDRGELRDAEMAIEAATENLELKLRILKQVEEVVSPDALLATNTSSISITQLAATLSRPERFVGMHFFNPVPLMALVELIRGLQTSDDAHARALAFAKRIGKTPITVRTAPASRSTGSSAR
jgi:3-hydroxybutyryl-CoA dehydrogenase